ncbi:MAG TPA: 8-amino-7-oxononanoate synthase [Syntrophaceae bacterium]|nr:8-amino-7-oxononanoate synthase [Syntrophaceae bacterium]
MEWIDRFLQKREDQLLLRTLHNIEKRKGGNIVVDGKELIDLSCNDYLGLAAHPCLLQESKRMAEGYGTSSSASRLMSGDLHIHHLLEEVVADFKGKEASLVFGSGFLANIGIISAICQKGDVVFSDRLNHASIIDGILLSGAQFFRFRHNEVGHLEDLLKKERAKFKKALIVIETIYSMDGDRPPLKEIVNLKERYNCILMVDEAHATGIFGRNGAGIVEEEDLTHEVDIIMGTFGKALGSYGAYVAASKKTIDYLVNRARSFIYSTALPPSVIGANLAAIEIVKKEPFRRKILLEHVEYFRSLLKDKGFNTRGSSQIIPVVMGDNKKTIMVAHMLREHSIFALPIRPPTVPKGEERIRFSVTYHHSKEILYQVAEVLKDASNGI